MADPFVRQDIWALEEQDPWDPVTLGYALAVRGMKKRPADDPTSWTYQAAIHAVASARPPDRWRGQCQHNSWYFLPWHRMYLYWFERIVRSIVAGLEEIPEESRASWALPYWDYDRSGSTSSLPPGFRHPELPPEYQLPDDSSNPLFVSQRHPLVNRGALLPPQITSAATALGHFVFSAVGTTGRDAGFGGPVTDWHHYDEMGTTRGGLEQTPHNDIHGTVGGGPGGFMSTLSTAPLDPIFWLHHCNIDRLWVAWINKGDGRQNPAETRWTDSVPPFYFHDEQANEVTMRPGEVVDTVANLGYVYDNVIVPAVPEIMPGMPPRPPDDGLEKAVPPPELMGATEEAVELVGDEISVDVPLAEPGRPGLEGLDLTPRRVYLNVEEIEAEANPGLSYGVYVNAPDDSTTKDDYRAGNISFFGIELASDPDREHPGGHGMRHAFDITALVDRLRAEGRWDPERVKVTLSPLRPIPPPGLEVRLEEAAEPTLPVRIGRVSFFYE